MSALDDLIKQVPDENLREQLKKEFERQKLVGSISAWRENS